MRVLVVASHYPPELFTGATLVAQRTARGLRDRGHEVLVYAGSLERDRPPLSVREDADETGLPVRWLAVRPYIGWAKAQNHDHPAVVEDLTRVLGAFRPDIVHVHVPQGFGGGIASAARRAGARVVVTMHDFWWICGRQFLATDELRPCSLVVDAGGCPCAVDHPWLLRRNARLRTALTDAHLVLAPSASAADVLRANGIPRVDVDENGLPEFCPAARSPRPDGTVRLLYAGGSDPLKGWPVLAAALDRLPAEGWTLTAYGIESIRPGLVPVTCRPRYRPDDLADILAGHDVLVVPSVMRETQSVLTREALQAGLPVVCTDTLGPEEVVVDGVNGRVVPAADAVALAGALADVVAHPDALTAEPGSVALRTVEEQVVGLENRYARLMTAPPPLHRTWPRRVLVVAGIDGAPLRYRAHLPAEALRLHGIRVDVRAYEDRSVPRLARRAEALLLYRVPATPQLLDLLAALRAGPEPLPVLVDLDDLVFDPSLEGTLRGLDGLTPTQAALWWRGVRRYRTTLEHADAFVTTTPLLAERATALTGVPSTVVPNGVGLVMARTADAALRRERAPGPLRIGYFSGTDTHDHDWAEIEPAVAELLTARPDVELWLGGLLRTGPALGAVAAQVRRLPFLPWRDLVAVLRDVDVNLAPLAPESDFNAAKSAIKWLESALVETPTVASPTPPFLAEIEHGRNGMLATDRVAWTAALTALLDDRTLRTRLGTRARRDALLRHAPHLQGDRYLTVLDAARDRVRVDGPRLPTADWTPVMADEPWRAAPLERYGDDRRGPDVVDSLRRLRRVAETRQRGLRLAVGRAARASGLRPPLPAPPPDHVVMARDPGVEDP
jgi:glycosyltransferase involved in cell wall biosynthesis